MRPAVRRVAHEQGDESRVNTKGASENPDAPNAVSHTLEPTVPRFLYFRLMPPASYANEALRRPRDLLAAEEDWLEAVRLPALRSTWHH